MPPVQCFSEPTITFLFFLVNPDSLSIIVISPICTNTSVKTMEKTWGKKEKAKKEEKMQLICQDYYLQIYQYQFQ